ncbi:hypothetical protein PCL_00114 [Purpureocillium lilacinum]|uniref:Uncharacterized protein n=1 Tax=Purpureocillium lilacinum TaxID=33203 RepID=A0A2U3E636_PURLI|nr:hypothetical protein PCL_00114 [Purpureocillium lilacinum]
MMPLLPEKYVAPSSIQGSTGTHVRVRRTFARVGWSGPDSAGLEISHRRELASSQWVCGPQLQPPGTSIAPELCPAGHDTMHHHRVGSTGLEKSVPRMRRKSTFGELSVLGLPVKPPEPECLVLDIHGQGTPAARSTCQQMVFDQPEDQGVPGICDAVLAGPPTRTRANMMSGKASSSRPENAECRGMRHKASETRR